MNFFLSFIFLLVSCLCSGSQEEPWSTPPMWASFNCYAKTITAWELKKLLEETYVPDGSWKSWITITPSAALIEPSPGTSERILLPLATSLAECRSVPRYWKKHPGKEATRKKPLTGFKIVIDPGHLGGAWAKMEERYFRIGHSKPVEEGTMAFLTAHLLAKRLQALGATVHLTRTSLGPTTALRPQQLRAAAVAQLQKEGVALTPELVKKRAELLFYRTSELFHRAEMINQHWKPDLVVCLHFDAEEWGDPKHPQLTDSNRLHFLISGNFNERELQTAQDRYILLRKLLGRTHQEEVDIAQAVAKSFVATTDLLPFTYYNPEHARLALPPNPYLWNRNLLITRLVQAPVLYCEAYCMNDRDVFRRIQLGDYHGYKIIGSKRYRSIYREYADAVTQGLQNYFKTR